MDSLTKNAIEAKQAGMSYGKWKAMQPQQEKQDEKIPDGWIKCLHCGKPFKPTPNQKFCEYYCRYLHNLQEKRKQEKERAKDG